MEKPVTEALLTRLLSGMLLSLQTILHSSLQVEAHLLILVLMLTVTDSLLVKKSRLEPMQTMQTLMVTESMTATKLLAVLIH